MAVPRKVSVALTVGLGARPVDVTNDLVSCSFEETIAGAGQTLDLTVDNASGFYIGIWYLEKGTPIVATIITSDWNNPGDNFKRTTGTAGGPGTRLVEVFALHLPRVYQTNLGRTSLFFLTL